MSSIMTYNPRIDMSNDCTPITLDEVIDAIKRGCLPIHGSTTTETVKDVKLKIDTTTDSAIKSKLKNSLPVFVAAGEFNHRNADGLGKYSHYMIADLDYKTPEAMKTRAEDWEIFKSRPYVRVMFTSPTGGIKLIIYHNNDNKRLHKQLFGQVAAAINSDKWDTSGKDVARACFFSYDPDLYENPDCEMFNFSPMEEVEFNSSTKSTSSVSDTSVSSAPLVLSILSEAEEREAIKRVQSWSNSNFPICKGYRHTHLFMFAQRLCVLGVSKQSALEYLILKYIGIDKGDELTGEEIVRLVENGYNPDFR
ncbi:MAG: BT4734/BF3469 family protein [Rikenellaceae bacterium]